VHPLRTGSEITNESRSLNQKNMYASRVEVADEDPTDRYRVAIMEETLRQIGEESTK